MIALAFQEQGMFSALAFLNSSMSQNAEELKNSALLGQRLYLLISMIMLRLVKEETSFTGFPQSFHKLRLLLTSSPISFSSLP